MNARRLLGWGDLEERRRRQARTGVAAWPLWLHAALGGLVLAAEIARRVGLFGSAAAGDATLAGASKLVLLVAAVGQTLVVFGAPFRLYWRHDAPMLSRLAVGGRALFAVALVRSGRAAGRAFLLSALGALVFVAVPGGAALALRHLAVIAAAALMAGLLAPAMALAAGAMVSSDKVQAALDSFGGEFRGPRTSWLGVLPGVTGTAVALVILSAAPWARGEAETTMIGAPALLLGGAVLVAIAAAAWALARAGDIMAVALREVVALDQERLAHVDLVTPSLIERLVAGRLLGGADRAGVVFDKDARLLRRRYPIPFFLGVVGLATLVVVGWTQPADALMWAATIAAGLGVYGAVMARRLVSPPTEHPRFLRSLPAGVGALRAKRARVILWTACYIVPGAVVVIARAPAPATAALALGLVAAAAIALGLMMVRD